MGTPAVRLDHRPFRVLNGGLVEVPVVAGHGYRVDAAAACLTSYQHEERNACHEQLTYHDGVSFSPLPHVRRPRL